MGKKRDKGRVCQDFEVGFFLEYFGQPLERRGGEKVIKWREMEGLKRGA